MSISLENSHIDIYNENIELLIEIEEKLDSEYLENLPVSTLKQLFNEEIIPKLHTISHPVAAENVFGMAVGFPHTYVRYRLVEIVQKWLPYSSAIEAIIRLTHDPDDLVSFRAIEICGEEKIEESYKLLAPIIGGASKKVLSPNKPVGLGAQKVLTSLMDLLGTEDPHELEIIENYYKERKHLFNANDFEEPIPQELLEEFCKREEEGMILIPGGFFTFGLDPHQVPDKMFGWYDAAPSQKVWLPPFFIDKYPVTNSEYDEFVSQSKESDHEFCHSNEPLEKNHTRNTFWDERFKPEHPVTGIDWYDAFAFARWRGKELPTEYQWEKAARGPSGQIWPWGNSFNEEAVNWCATWLGYSPNTLPEWRKGITSFSEDYPIEPVKQAEVFDKKEYNSPYGVVGMVGNHWEWTRSDLLTGRQFQPVFANKETKHHDFAVLKGGSFFSIPGLMYPSFRGKDIPFCRHNEMGFRCVKNIPIHIIRKAIGKPITNTALY
ncbi:formylglycine-generating enzyme family protein [Bacillus wiedmannii]